MTKATKEHSLFDFKGHEIRVAGIDGQPWFVARDICAVLGFKHLGSSMSNHLAPLGSDEKQRAPKNLSLARRPLIISESGLYKLVMRSDKAEARALQDWVTRDVLPAIRKDDGYVMGEEKVATGEMSEDELILRAMEMQRKKIDRISQENDAMRHELETGTLAAWCALNHF